ncbi:MAG: glycosyltransferase family 9 protein [Candidatus Wallbacteria bacterium]|nr:glycosyltransferase family 9 protein [Candidatus Wallbacteria bacterium]
MNILVIRYSALGDAVLAYPVLDFLVLSGNRVAFLCPPGAAKILENPGIEYIDFSRNTGVFRRLSLLWCLRKNRFDLVIDLQNNRFSRRWRSFLGRDCLSVKDDPSSHALECYASAVKEMFPVFRLQATYCLPCIGKLPPGLPERYACLFFSASTRWKSKMPSAQLGRKIAQHLMEKGVVPVLIGGPEDRRAHAGMNLPDAVDLTGSLNLTELKSVLAGSELVVSTDSFPMHLAAFCNGRVLGLFGPTDQKRCGPWSEKAAVVCRDLPCRPCYRSKCRKNICMELDWENVREAMGRVIGNW